MKIVAALLALLPATAAAQGFAPESQGCAMHHEMTAQLEQIYGEYAMLTAVTADDYLMQIFGNPETGTWSQIFTERTTTLSCLAAEGSGGWSIDEAAGMF